MTFRNVPIVTRPTGFTMCPNCGKLMRTSVSDIHFRLCYPCRIRIRKIKPDWPPPLAA